MNNTIGIRHEDKYVMERRVAITPAHAKALIEEQNLEILIEKSPKRIFTEKEYEDAGATSVFCLNSAPVVFGVKEMPIDFFEDGKTYVFFSHVIKGQPYNMPMLKHMMDLNCTLIDYEKIANDKGQRLIFFGRFAGLAGMINSFWSLGERLKVKGIDNPFIKLKQSHKYNSLEEAKDVLREIGEEIKENGLPEEITPLTIGFTGYGNVSLGAQEIADILPFEEITPDELTKIEEKETSNKLIYKTVFKESDISKTKDGSEFELQHYYNHPEAYENNFEQYVPHMSILMNCMYWDDNYPRIVTKDYLEGLFKNNDAKLLVIGDITCDPDGSIECTHIGTEIEDPVFVYNTETREPTMGFKGEGVLVMSVDILPSELPRESSETFSDALFDYVKAIANADYNVPFQLLDLPAPIKGAMILHKGNLTPDYEYIKEYLNA